MTEHDEQVALIAWSVIAARTFPCLVWLHAIPNGGKRSIGTAVKLRREGVRAGVADLFLPMATPDFHGLYIEMKTATGRQSSDQRAFEAHVVSTGYHYVVARSWTDAATAILSYLSATPAERVALLGVER